MNFNQFANRLLIVTVLIIGLQFFNVAFHFLVLRLRSVESAMLLHRYGSWVGSLIFGVVIYFLARERGMLAIPIAVLAVAAPAMGGIFYLLTLVTIKTNHEGKAF